MVKKIYLLYVSKYNTNHEKQVILFIIISNGEKQWYYLTIKKISALLREITSKHHGYFYCHYIFIKIIMSSEDTKILEFNQYQKSDKAPSIIYAENECIIGKIDGCKNNPENPPETKVSKHITSGFSMFTISSFRNIKNKHDVYRGKDCMKNFCELLREQAMKIFNFEKKKMKLLKKKQQESYGNTIIFVKKNLKRNI